MPRTVQSRLHQAAMLVTVGSGGWDTGAGLSRYRAIVGTSGEGVVQRRVMVQGSGSERRLEMYYDVEIAEVVCRLCFEETIFVCRRCSLQTTLPLLKFIRSGTVSELVLKLSQSRTPCLLDMNV